MSAVLIVMAGAAIGAPVRFLVDRAVQARHDSVFPWGTLVVNVVGSFVLGSLRGRCRETCSCWSGRASAER